MTALATAFAVLLTVGATAMATPAAQAATRVVRVPASIDHDGSRDVSSQLQRFVNGVPNNSRIVFRARGVYRLDDGLVLLNRRNLVFDGNGATIRARGSGSRPMDSPFALMHNDQGITIRDFKLVGNNPDAGTARAYHGGAEHLAGVYLGGAKDILIEDVSIRDFYGDCVYIGASGTTWSRGVTFQDSSCTRTGRHGVGLIAGRDVLIQRVRFDKVGFMVVDIEPDRAVDGAADVVIRKNTVGSYGLTNRYVCWFVAASAGARGATVRRLTIAGNKVTGVGRAGYDGKAWAISVIIDGRIGPRSSIVIRGNRSSRTVARTDHGAPILIRNASGVTITGNRQPMRSGAFALISGSSNVVNKDNSTRR
ncbi:MAG: right-handed parallel beta-helix repeat-containing protein [Chloroflexota bacterium]